MTHDQTVLCTRCGFANAPGDQFCGSCGTFLEWEGAAAGVAADPGTPAPAPVASAAVGDAGPIVGPGPAATPMAPAAGAPTTAPPGGSPLPPIGPPGEGLLRCPSCGIANAASRTFCQTCGAKLTPAARIASRSRDEIAAAVAAVPGPRPVQPGPPAPGRAPGVAPRGAAPKGGGGLPVWIVVVIVLGVLAGVAAVVGSNLLKGSIPDPAISAAPSLGSPGGTSSAAAASPGPASSAVASAASSPSAAPALVGKPLKLTRAAASSIALGDTTRYGAQNAIDGSLKTSWQEGSPNEKGEWIEVSFDPSTVTGVVIRNGFQASTALYKGNLRLKDVQISVDGGAPLAVRLKDTTSAQKINLAPVAGATRVRITIVSTYPSVKTSVNGTPFDDAAVSEIGVLGVPAP
ncbi:MAG: NADase-type glycan-binding domain-containing protein [Candidatus Limnocylindrales bacterium]